MLSNTLWIVQEIQRACVHLTEGLKMSIEKNTSLEYTCFKIPSLSYFCGADVYIYIYIYMYVCICVCVCV